MRSITICCHDSQHKETKNNYFEMHQCKCLWHTKDGNKFFDTPPIKRWAYYPALESELAHIWFDQQSMAEVMLCQTFKWTGSFCLGLLEVSCHVRR